MGVGQGRAVLGRAGAGGWIDVELDPGRLPQLCLGRPVRRLTNQRADSGVMQQLGRRASDRAGALRVDGDYWTNHSAAVVFDAFVVFDRVVHDVDGGRLHAALDLHALQRPGQSHRRRVAIVGVP